MNNKKSYAIIPNVAFGFGAKYHLNNDEFMVFAHLQFMKQVGLENTTITMVDMLVKGLGWETSTKSRDKKRVVEAIEGLQLKGYITIKHEGKILKDVLVITINKELEKFEAETKVDWKENPFLFKGFTRIEWNEYNLAENNGYYLIIITYVKWRTNPELKYDYKICVREWESVLNVSDKTVRDRLEECTTFITKIAGGHYHDKHGQVKQEANTYTLNTEVHNPSKIKETHQEVKKESYLDKERQKVTDIKVISNEDIFKQIFDKKTFIRFEGYKVWKETECPHVREAGKKKIESMYKSPKKGAKEAVDRLEREYQEYLSNQKKQSEWVDRQMASMDEYEEYVPSYVPKPCNAITDFLDD